MELTLVLMKDSTYSYKYWIGGWAGNRWISCGTWHVYKKDRIVLQSYISDMENISIMVKEIKDDSNPYSIIIFNNPLKLDTFIEWTLNINGIDYLMNNDSVVLEENVHIDSFYIQGYKNFEYLGPRPRQEIIRSVTYRAINSDNNIFCITFTPLVNEYIFHYRTFNDTIRVGNNKLYLPTNIGAETKLKKI
jgi:hypothetical protein